jgi:tetratricopeptide (TPR) repeat protein
MNYSFSGTSHPPKSSTDSSSPIHTVITYQSYQWSFQLIPGSTSHITTIKAAKPTFLHRPRPMAASEPPITLSNAIRKMNHHLLRSCALLAHEEPDEALEEADYALYLAEARAVYHLQSKSQLYRGLCLMELERWEEASAAFTRAANVRGWGARIAELKIEAERKIAEACERGEHGKGS